jgi:transcriptional regulator with XRE-family HTH domain
VGKTDPYVQAAAERFSGWLGSELRDRRMTQAELSQRIGVQRSLVSKWCGGTTLPTPSNAARIADALGVDLQFVFQLISPQADTANFRKRPEMDYDIWHLAVTEPTFPLALRQLARTYATALVEAATEMKKSR